jgi:poly(3-hydroxybutyrate) depolymerase
MPAFSGKVLDKKKDGYIAYVPDHCRKDKPMPLLVVLPGLHMSAKDEIDKWKFYAEKKGFVTVGIYVDYDNIRLDKLYGGIIDAINVFYLDKKKFSIDKKRLFLAGTSLGGMASMKMSLLIPGRFRGTAVVSGSHLHYVHITDELRNAKGQDFMLLHGKNDTKIFLKDFYETKDALEKNGAHVEFYINEKVGHNMCSDDYKRAIEWMSDLK